ncbi:hypothetical protein MMC25_007330 [Agyrium rufum]|nr:hypothetical protein [Agyrium rufum]
MDLDRWTLRAQALLWQGLLNIGQMIHRIPAPKPPRASFTRTVTVSSTTYPGTFQLHFYTAASYQTLRQLEAVVVSVDYRLAPTYPYPTGVDDGVSAMRYLSSHAEELGLDIEKIITSGFSSGGNFAFTVPMKYKHCLEESTLSDLVERPCKVIAIVSFYPLLDYRTSREEKRATNIRPEHNLSTMFTDLFDSSYLYPRESINLSDPFLSPSAADDESLRRWLPHDVVLFACERRSERA